MEGLYNGLQDPSQRSQAVSPVFDPTDTGPCRRYLTGDLGRHIESIPRVGVSSVPNKTSGVTLRFLTNFRNYVKENDGFDGSPSK